MGEYPVYLIGDICDIVKGETGLANAVPGDFPLVSTGAERKSSNTFQFDTEAVCIPLVSSTGHGKKTLNYVHYQEGRFALGTILAAVIPKDKNFLSASYLHRYLQFYKDRKIVPLMKGAANVSLAVKDIAKIEVSVPPIDIQNDFICLFNKIYTSDKMLESEFNIQSDILAKLRQTILQEAVEGKLTADWRKANPLRSGNPEYDGTALLAQIKAEKQKMIDAGKIKKEKPLAPIKPDEVPFALPAGWVWTRLGEIWDSMKYGTSKNCDYKSNRNSKVLRIPNVSSGYINDDDLKYCDLDTLEKEELALEQNDILVIRSNGSRELVGKMMRVSDKFIGYAYAGYLIRLRFNKKLISAQFVWLITSTYYFRELIEKPLRTTVGINNINSNELSKLLVPLPPLAEQQVLVERVENLLAMVNELEAQTKERKAQAEELVQAVLREAFGG